MAPEVGTNVVPGGTPCRSCQICQMRSIAAWWGKKIGSFGEDRAAMSRKKGSALPTQLWGPLCKKNSRDLRKLAAAWAVVGKLLEL